MCHTHTTLTHAHTWNLVSYVNIVKKKWNSDIWTVAITNDLSSICKEKRISSLDRNVLNVKEKQQFFVEHLCCCCIKIGVHLSRKSHKFHSNSIQIDGGGLVWLHYQHQLLNTYIYIYVIRNVKIAYFENYYNKISKNYTFINTGTLYHCVQCV